jgi:hypothetical protein
MNHNVLLTRFSDGIVRISGGILHNVEIHDWEDPRGRLLLWMDECGDLHTDEIAGLIQVRLEDIKARSHLVARRACVTNSLDLAAALETWNEYRCLTGPELVWLGIRRSRDYKNDRQDRNLPLWSVGFELIEAEDPTGCFGALAYLRADELERFKANNDWHAWYVAMLVDELQDVPFEDRMEQEADV